LKPSGDRASLARSSGDRRTNRVVHAHLPYRISLRIGILAVLAILVGCGGDTSRSEVDALRKEVAELKAAQAVKRSRCRIALVRAPHPPIESPAIARDSRSVFTG